MTDAAILAIATAVPLTVAAIANLIVSLRTKTEVAQVKAEVADVKEVAVVTAGHVNSAATKSAEQITALLKEVSGLREDRAEKKQIAALVAQAAVTTAVMQPVTMTNGVTVKSQDGESHLEQIEQNTEETAANTKRTDATVAELKKES